MSSPKKLALFKHFPTLTLEKNFIYKLCEFIESVPWISPCCFHHKVWLSQMERRHARRDDPKPKQRKFINQPLIFQFKRDFLRGESFRETSKNSPKPLGKFLSKWVGSWALERLSLSYGTKRSSSSNTFFACIIFSLESHYAILS